MLNSNQLIGFGGKSGVGNRSTFYDYGASVGFGIPCYTLESGEIVHGPYVSGVGRTAHLTSRSGAVKWVRSYGLVSGFFNTIVERKGKALIASYNDQGVSPVVHYLAEINQGTGALDWHKKYSHATDDITFSNPGYAADATHLYATIQRGANYDLAKINRSTGAIVWLVGMSAGSIIRSVDVDGSGNVYLGITLTSGAGVVLIEKLNSSGTRVWATSLYTDAGTYNNDNSVYAAVNGDGTVSFLLSKLLTSTFHRYNFIGRLAADGASVLTSARMSVPATGSPPNGVSLGLNEDIIVTVSGSTWMRFKKDLSAVVCDVNILTSGSGWVHAYKDFVPGYFTGTGLGLYLPPTGNPIFGTVTLGGTNYTLGAGSFASISAGGVTLTSGTYTPVSRGALTETAASLFVSTEQSNKITEIASL